jgi:RHS repeat-associated protein
MRVPIAHRQTILGRVVAIGAITWVGLVAPVQAQTPSESVEYYGLDAIGSVRIVFDANGAVLGRQDYGPYGRPLFPATGLPPERFGGQPVDGEIDQGDFEARQYQMRTGRFTRVDPIYDGILEPQRWNRYAYALNNPVRFIDPHGLLAAADFCQTMFVHEDFRSYVHTDCLSPEMLAFLGGYGWTGNGPESGGSDPFAAVGRVDFPVLQPLPGPVIAPPPGPVIKPAPPAVPVITDDGGVTVFGGVEGTLIGGVGVTASTGHFLGSSGGCGPDAGSFGSLGAGVGLDAGVGVFGGMIKGPVSNLSGDALNLNVTFLGFYNVSFIFNTKGKFIGATGGVSLGVPLGLSVTATTTGLVGQEHCRRR